MLMFYHEKKNLKFVKMVLNVLRTLIHELLRNLFPGFLYSSLCLTPLISILLLVVHSSSQVIESSVKAFCCL